MLIIDIKPEFKTDAAYSRSFTSSKPCGIYSTNIIHTVRHQWHRNDFENKTDEAEDHEHKENRKMVWRFDTPKYIT